ncbi:MAG: hypothetical protein WB866_11190 [Solirubrobacterales bacterium]
MSRRLVVTVALIATFAATAVAATSAGGRARIAMLGPGYSVQINPADFTTRINNAWFPLKPGTRFVYSSTKDRSPSDVMTVTRRTAVLDSVLCVVVHDYVYESGKLSEKTNDYYAQNKDGSVWYFGEDAFDAGKHGKLTLSPDTWHSGVDGALPGVFMPPNPQLGEQHYQEYYPGHAEDQFQVTSLSARVRVPFGSFKHTLETSETSRLEPGVVDRDYYVRGVGQVLERAGAGGHTALIRVVHRR